MIDLGTLLRPIEQVVPSPLLGGASAVVADLDSAEGRALLESMSVLANQAIAGAAGEAITASLGNEAAVLGQVLDAGHEVDDVAWEAEAVVQAAIRDLTDIAGDCLAELSSAAPATMMNPMAAGTTLLPIALRHWERAEVRYQQMEAELTELTQLVERVEIPVEHSEVVQAAQPDAPTDTAPPSSGQASAAVAAAKSALGTPYQWGGTTPGQGLDCSGLTQWAYAQAGVDIPRTAEAQAVGPQIPRDQVQPGDLAVWDGHVAMVVEDGQMIEAGDPVQINPIRQDNIGMTFRGFYRPTAA